MKTTRQRILNIVITMSVVINVALLGGLGYLAVLDNHVDRVCSVMNSPVLVYVNNATKIPGVTTATQLSAKP